MKKCSETTPKNTSTNKKKTSYKTLGFIPYIPYNKKQKKKPSSCQKRQKRTTEAGFEPARAKHNRFRIELLGPLGHFAVLLGA